MTQSSDADKSVEWRAGFGRPPSVAGTLQLAMTIVVVPLFILMVVVRFNANLAWLLQWLGGIAVLGMLAGIYGNLYDRRSVVSVWLEPHADVPTVTVLRSNDVRASYPLSTVDRIEVTRTREEPPSLAMRLRTGNRTEHTKFGLAEAAEPLLGEFTLAGVSITTRVLDKTGPARH